MTKFWKPFVQLTLVTDQGDDAKGTVYLDVNSRLTMVRNFEFNYTMLVVGDHQGYYVKETPEEINDIVMARIDEQKKEQAAEEERLRKEWEERAKEFEGTVNG
jgi:uncharacterized membrane protein